MQLHGLKFLADKGWNPESTYHSDNGKVYPIPANQKVVCTDENGDVCNLTLQVAAPVSFKPSESLKPIVLTGSVSHSAFGWSVKGRFA